MLNNIHTYAWDAVCALGQSSTTPIIIVVCTCLTFNGCK